MGVMHVMIVIVTIVVPLPSDLDVDTEAVTGGVAVIAGNRVVRATQPATKAPATLLFVYSDFARAADPIGRSKSGSAGTWPQGRSPACPVLY